MTNRLVSLRHAFLLCAASLVALPVISPVLRADPVTTVTVEGISYDVTYHLLNSFDSELALFQSQVWWGNATLAGEFALAVGDSLGHGNFNSQAPYFAYTTSGADWLGAYTYTPSFSTVATFEAPTSGWAGRWAVVVPQASVDDSTSTLALMFVALSALGVAKRRRKSVSA